MKNKEQNKLFNDLFDSSVKKEPLKKAERAGHKYIKRTGSPGNYRYWYRDTQGRVYSGDDPAPATTKKEKTPQEIVSDNAIPKVSVARKLRVPEQFKQGDLGRGVSVKPSKAQLSDLLNHGQYSIISAGKQDGENISDEDLINRHELLEKELRGRGYKFSSIIHNHPDGSKSESFMVYGAKPKDIEHLGLKYGQESVIHSDGNKHTKNFIQGPNKGKSQLGIGHKEGNDANEIQHQDGTSSNFGLNFDEQNLYPTGTSHDQASPAGTVNWQIHPSNKGVFWKEGKQTLSYEKDKNGGYNLFHNGKQINGVPYVDQKHALYGFSKYIEQFPEFKTGKLIKAHPMKGQMRPGHKYIRRTGGPGNYRYWYQDDKGNLYSSDNPVGGQEGAKESSNIVQVSRKDKKPVVKKIKVKSPKIVVKPKDGSGAGGVVPYKVHFSDKNATGLDKTGHEDLDAHRQIFVSQGGKVIGSLNTSGSTFGFPIIKDHKIDKEHQNKGLIEKMLREAINRYPSLTSQPYHKMDEESKHAWDMLVQENPQVSYDESSGRYVYKKEGTKEQTSDPFTSTQANYGDFAPETKEWNKHLAPAAEKAFEAFSKNTRDFKPINAGMCGKKGLVTLGDKKYFVKGEVDLAEQENLFESQTAPESLTNHEITHNEIIHTIFPEIKEHFPAKIRLSNRTFMQEHIDMSDDSGSIMDVENMDATHVAKVALVNIILGNKDRHAGNIYFTPDLQNFKLFDEGLVFNKPSDAFGNKIVPHYVSGIHNGAPLDDKEIDTFMTDDRIKQVMDICKKNGIDQERINEIQKRYDRFKLHFGITRKAEWIPAKYFLERLAQDYEPIQPGFDSETRKK